MVYVFLHSYYSIKELVENHAMFDATIFYDVHIQKHLVNRYKIQVLCYIPDSLPKNYGN